MEKEQFEEIREFALTLTQKRLQMPDGQLLDLCQQHLNALVAELADNYEEAPHDNAEEVAPEPPEEPEPEPPPHAEDSPLHDERREHHHVTAHKPVQHKKPTPRKTHR